MENDPKTDGYLKVEMFWCHSKDVEGFRSMTRVANSRTRCVFDPSVKRQMCLRPNLALLKWKESKMFTLSETFGQILYMM